ncbi:hypothetical protein ACVIW2_002403 [Bradyrhizobium huanghuaihaiense]|uniref:Uncharacterized protein n=1 Tax=Bradyrhizobium huanghuaihaiense TaxID=990078 RepID=A0A562R6J8_9BRAD|nr:hypothetical protein IQ16_05740 [Bradyrhizobium huanghuaihaiense]
MYAGGACGSARRWPHFLLPMRRQQWQTGRVAPVAFTPNALTDPYISLAALRVVQALDRARGPADPNLCPPAMSLGALVFSHCRTRQASVQLTQHRALRPFLADTIELGRMKEIELQSALAGAAARTSPISILSAWKRELVREGDIRAAPLRSLSAHTKLTCQSITHEEPRGEARRRTGERRLTLRQRAKWAQINPGKKTLPSLDE